MQENEGSIRVRFAATGEEAAVDMQTLREWIVTGRLSADDQVSGAPITGGEWKALRNRRIFYTVRGLLVPESVESEDPDPARAGTGRYPELRMISTACRVLAIVVAVATVIAAIVAASTVSSLSMPGMPSVSSTALVGVGSIIVEGAIVSVLLWALAELIPLWIDIESNTRSLQSPPDTP